jgi:hypothetical protein
MTDLNNELNDKKIILNQKEAELNILLINFLNGISKNVNLKFIQVISKKNIVIDITNKGIDFLTFSFCLNKKDNSYSVQYNFKESFIYDKTIIDFSNMISLLIDDLNNIDKNYLFDFLKSYNTLDSSIKRLRNQISELNNDIKKQGNKSYFTALKSYLCSEKYIIENDKKAFLKEERLSKKLVYFTIKEFSTKKIYFKEGTLSVKLQSGRKRFEFNGNLIPKKEAIEILDNQIFIDKLQITSHKKVPFYKEPQMVQSYYHRYRKDWNIELDEYINQIKSILLQLKLIDF